MHIRTQRTVPESQIVPDSIVNTTTKTPEATPSPPGHTGSNYHSYPQTATSHAYQQTLRKKQEDFPWVLCPIENTHHAPHTNPPTILSC